MNNWGEIRRAARWSWIALFVAIGSLCFSVFVLLMKMGD